MIPFRDNIPPARVPYVNYAALAVCSAIWLWQLTAPHHGVYDYGMVPARLLGDDSITTTVTEYVLGMQTAVQVPIGPAAVPEWLTPVTSNFLHGPLAHFVPCMLLLWIFGDNVEDRLGHVGYAAFFVLTGAAGKLLFLAMDGGDSEFAVLGTSGSVAAIAGAYWYLYPDAKIQTFVSFGRVMRTFEPPAAWLLGSWLVLGLIAIALAWIFADTVLVSVWTGVIGFTTGLGVILVLGRTRRLRPAVKVRRRPPGRGRDQLRRFNPLREPR